MKHKYKSVLKAQQEILKAANEALGIPGIDPYYMSIVNHYKGEKFLVEGKVYTCSDVNVQLLNSALDVTLVFVPEAVPTNLKVSIA